MQDYPFVREQLYKLEKAADNANLNIQNSVAIRNFVQTGREVRRALREKYGQAFLDPATVDPRDDEKYEA